MINLHNHSCYSKKDGLNTPETLVLRAKELGQPALALTDHGEMSGLIQHHIACEKHGVKPIYGMEIYQCHKLGDKMRGAHLVLLVKNEIGWENLIKLNNLGYLEDGHFYYTMRVTWDDLEAYSEGLICLTGCLKGLLAQEILGNGAPYRILMKLYEIFGDDLYMEVMYHGMQEQLEVIKWVQKTCKELDNQILPVWTNDTHYSIKDDSEVHDMLMCCQYNVSWNEKDKAAYFAPEFYLKNQDDLLFPAGYEDWCKWAVSSQPEIADKCQFKLELGKPALPKLGMEDELFKLAMDGFNEIYGGKLSKNVLTKYRKRFNYEWDIIKDRGFADYIYIVHWYTNEARKIMRVGPGRGSVSGSLFCQCLGITDPQLDPIKYNLIFERFISPERISYPDVDNDFERKDEVAQMVADRFGSIASVSNHAFYKMFSAFQDAGKVLGYSDKDVKAWTTARDPYNKPRGDIDEHPDILKYSDRMSESMRNTGTHAAGIVLLTRSIPLYRGGNSQWDKDDIESYGLVKFDILGLTTLKIVTDTINLAGIEEPDWSYDDQKVFDSLNKGNVTAVFQMEKCKQLAKTIGVKDIHDLIALVAINRPGPKDAGTDKKYGRNRQVADKIEYPPGLELAKPILEDTYHTLVYQEQVMEICVKLGGFTYEEAEKFRKAITKWYSLDSVPELPKKFFQNLTDKGVDRVEVERLWKSIEGFAGYAFNRAHATAYGMIAYQTAWLRENYPYEFMASHLSVVDEKKRLNAERECRKIGIPIQDPHVAISNAGYTLVNSNGNKMIFRGLNTIKGIAQKTSEKIMAARPFSSIEDVHEKLAPGVVKKLEGAGALRSVDI